MPCGIPVGQATAVTIVEQTAASLTNWANDASDSATDALDALTNISLPGAFNPGLGYEFDYISVPTIPQPSPIVNPLEGLTIDNNEFNFDEGTNDLPSVDDVTLDLSGVEDPGTFSPINDPTINYGGLVKPDDLNATKPTAPNNIREFNENDYPDLPTIEYACGLTIPCPPTLEDLDFPAAPDITLPTSPDFVSPTLSAPLPNDVLEFFYTPYSSDLQTAVSGELLDRIQNGGTGLNNSVEQAIWDRARNREDINANRSELEVINAQEARGFERPTGSHLAALDFLAQETQSKIADLSREVAIKQAELEQRNLEYSIQAAISLEGQLLQAHLQQQDLAFRAAEAKVRLAYELYGLQINQLQAELDIYKTNFQVFTAQVQAELAEIEIYKTQIEAQAQISQVNNQLVDIYRARIGAVSEAVNVFRAETDAVNSQVEAEKLKLDLYGSELDAYTKEIEAFRSEYDGYVAQLNAEKTKADIYKTEADVYATRVQAYATQVDVRAKEADVAIEGEKLELDAYRSRLALQDSKFSAAKAKAQAISDYVRSEGTRFASETQLGIATTTASIKASEANASIARNKSDVALSNAQVYSSNINAYRDALLRGAISLAELTSATQQSAMGALDVGAKISSNASDSLSQSYRCN